MLFPLPLQGTGVLNSDQLFVCPFEIPTMFFEHSLQQPPFSPVAGVFCARNNFWNQQAVRHSFFSSFVQQVSKQVTIPEGDQKGSNLVIPQLRQHIQCFSGSEGQLWARF